MRIYKAVCSLALLALSGASTAPAATADPNSDFDCAVVSEFFFRVAQDQKLPTDQLKEFVIVGLWYDTIWQRDHPGEDTRTNDRYIPLVQAIGANPKPHGETMKACAARADTDPTFRQFAASLRASSPDAK